jgi:hypothetical protein
MLFHRTDGNTFLSFLLVILEYKEIKVEEIVEIIINNKNGQLCDVKGL